MRATRLRIEVQHDADDLVRDIVGDLLPKEDDALAVQPVVEVHLRACRHASFTSTDGHPGRERGSVTHPVRIVGTGRSVRHL